MELTHLRYFVSVAEELHFGRAAKKLHISQPPLSQQIMKLEEELGVKLFNRTNRRVELSHAGKLFLADAKVVIEQADNASTKMQDLASGTKGSLSLGFNEPVINTFLSSAIKSYREKYPGIKLSLHELETFEQLNALRNRQIDLGMLRPYEQDLTDLDAELLFKEQYLVAISADLNISEKSPIRLKELSGQSLIMFPRHIQPALHDRLLEDLVKAGFPAKISQEATSKQTTLALVAAGMGVALVPESSAEHASGSIKFLHIEDELPSVDIYALWRKHDEMTAVKNFLNVITNLTRISHGTTDSH
jgi:DNA-binding transcriptional LysR family regulator